MCFFFNLNILFLCFLFFVCPSIFLLFRLEIWSKSKLILNPILHFIYIFYCISLLFDLSFLLPSFPFLVLSFLFPFICSTVILVPRYVPFSFPFLIIKVFLFSDNLSDNLSIIMCWKKGTPDEGQTHLIPTRRTQQKKEQVLNPRPSGCFRSHLQFLELLSWEVWCFLTPWLIKEGQLRGGPFLFS